LRIKVNVGLAAGSNTQIDGAGSRRVLIFTPRLLITP